MKIGILGYGKMGKMIEKLALADGHEISWRINQQDTSTMTSTLLQQADVAIEFSRPEAAVSNIKACLSAGIPVISGTTGWLDQFEEMTQYCKDVDGAFLYASNFSVGVNLFFALNRYLAERMNSQQNYSVEVEEIHHTQKLDAPSGTAISIANDILQQLQRKSHWVNHSEKQAEELAIISKREDPAPGTHAVAYQSSIDTIEIKHTAHSREGFAKGAIQAALWIIGKKGCFSMKDVLGF